PQAEAREGALAGAWARREAKHPAPDRLGAAPAREEISERREEARGGEPGAPSAPTPVERERLLAEHAGLVAELARGAPSDPLSELRHGERELERAHGELARADSERERAEAARAGISRLRLVGRAGQEEAAAL